MKPRALFRVLPIQKGFRWKVVDPSTVHEFETKREAVKTARKWARAMWERLATPSQLVIHKGDGTIETEHTYGRDPERHHG